MSRPIIEVKNLSKVYRISHSRKPYHTLREDLIEAAKTPIRFLRGHGSNKEDFWALKDVSFDVKQGEVLGIIGKNGAGKSTLLKILSRITTPTDGTAILHGRFASLLEVGTGFHPELTGRENIYLNGVLLGMSRQEIARKFDEIVDFAETEKFLDTPVKFYSSGMYVRLAFAVAAHLEPEILIVDEVLAVGDAAFQKKSLGKMSSVAKEGRTVLFVSHSMSAIEKLCTQCLLLENGKVKRFSSDVRSVTKEYLTNRGYEGRSSEWVNNGRIKSDYFIPQRFFLADKGGRKLKKPPTTNSEIWLQVEGEVIKNDPDFNIGCTVYSEDGDVLYYTNTKEGGQLKLEKGPIVLRNKIPKHFLNEGVYRVELNASLHFRQWLFEPAVNSPFITLPIKLRSDGSPYWMVRRPGLLIPEMEWRIVQD